MRMGAVMLQTKMAECAALFRPTRAGFENSMFENIPERLTT